MSHMSDQENKPMFLHKLLANIDGHKHCQIEHGASTNRSLTLTLEG